MHDDGSIHSWAKYGRGRWYDPNHIGLYAGYEESLFSVKSLQIVKTQVPGRNRGGVFEGIVAHVDTFVLPNKSQIEKEHRSSD